MIATGAAPWSRRTWPPPPGWSAELVAMLAEDARRTHAPYRIPCREPARPPASRVIADRLIRRYRMALL